MQALATLGDDVKAIGIGLVGTGYMGKAHAVALKSVGTVFNTHLRPVCEMLCSTTAEGAARKAAEFGFQSSTHRWEELVANPRVEAVVIASAFAGKRPVQRHQLVYSTLGSAVGNEIHALALQAYTPDEYAGQGRG